MKLLLILFQLTIISSCNVFTMLGEKTDISNDFNQEKNTENSIPNTTSSSSPEINFQDEIIDFNFKINQRLEANSSKELIITNIHNEEIYIDTYYQSTEDNIQERYNTCNSIYLTPGESCLIDIESFEKIQNKKTKLNIFYESSSKNKNILVKLSVED